MASLQAYDSHGHRYYRIVESFRQDGKPRLRVVAHLGRVEDILRLTRDERADIKVSSVTSGGVTALHHLAQELDIVGKIDRVPPQEASGDRQWLAACRSRPCSHGYGGRSRFGGRSGSAYSYWASHTPIVH